MTNILLEGYDIDAPWLVDALKSHLKPVQKVAVIALAFRDSQVKGQEDWDALFSKERGWRYSGIVGSFAAYGIPEDQIKFVNYFTDTPETAAQKIRDADVLYFLGGLPDRMLQRIREMRIYDAIMQHGGIYMGYSAGALIQLRDYHLSPDDDYPEFGYYSGLPLLDGFDLEVHYEGTPEQNASIRRVLREKRKLVYATQSLSGAILVHDGSIDPIGKVLKFEP